MISSTRPSGGGPWHLAARRAAMVAGAFSATVVLLLLANAVASHTADPLKSARLQSLQLQLNLSPRNEALKRQIRVLDRDVRRSYFRSQAFALTGFYLLLGGLALYLLALEGARQTRPVLPAPNDKTIQDAWLAGALGRRSTVVLAGALCGLFGFLAVLSRHDPLAEFARAAQHGSYVLSYNSAAAPAPAPATAPGAAPGTLPAGPQAGQRAALGPAAVQGPANSTPGAPVAPPLGVAPSGGGPSGLRPVGPAPVAAGGPSHGPAGVRPANTGPALAIEAVVSPEAAANWPRFRGPAGNGVAPSGDVPTAWDATSGKGILWKAPIPLPGWNSPIVWGRRVFCTGADKARRDVYCFDADKGTLVWKQAVALPPGGVGKLRVSEDAGYAPSTMATDGQRVYAIFVNGDLACFDMEGKPLWTKHLGAPDNNYGHASSLATYKDRLLLQLDQGSSPQDGKSLLMALEGATGKPVWQVKRPVPNSWSTPVVIQAGGRQQIVACGNPWVIAYDPATGKELWRAECLGGEVAPSPTFGGGFVLAGCLGSNLAAIRPGGTGNVSKTQVAWTGLDGLPDITSPVCDGKRVYLVTTEGLVTAIDVATGKKTWEHSFDDLMFHASPLLVGDKLYVFDRKGTAHILAAADSFSEIGTATVGEDVSATPAVVGGRIYIRAKDHLYCVGAR